MASPSSYSCSIPAMPVCHGSIHMPFKKILVSIALKLHFLMHFSKSQMNKHQKVWMHFMFFCHLWWWKRKSTSLSSAKSWSWSVSRSSSNAKRRRKSFPYWIFWQTLNHATMTPPASVSLSPSKSLVQSVTWARNGKWIAGLQVLVLRVLKNPRTIRLVWLDVSQC